MDQPLGMAYIEYEDNAELLPDGEGALLLVADAAALVREAHEAGNGDPSAVLRAPERRRRKLLAAGVAAGAPAEVPAGARAGVTARATAKARARVIPPQRPNLPPSPSPNPSREANPSESTQ